MGLASRLPNLFPRQNKPVSWRCLDTQGCCRPRLWRHWLDPHASDKLPLTQNRNPGCWGLLLLSGLLATRNSPLCALPAGCFLSAQERSRLNYLYSQTWLMWEYPHHATEQIWRRSRGFLTSLQPWNLPSHCGKLQNFPMP